LALWGGNEAAGFVFALTADGTDGRMGERGSDQINLGGERGANLSTVAVKMTRPTTKPNRERPSSLLCKASGESV